tara:strand:+ start:874 stop:1476 length:603 start_codon:yes stop_codon:yes gene_type:complete
MTTQGWFPIPLYLNKACGEVYDEIQEELLSCCNKTKFEQITNWAEDTHELSENPFGSNVLEDCPKFLDFLHDNLMSYMDDIGCPEFRKYIITQSWFTKTKHRKCAHLHTHGSADLSGVYYIQTNGRDGNLYFTDPNEAISFIFEGVVPPEPPLPLEQGLIAFWPSTLQHATHPNETHDERISLSFNIDICRKYDEHNIFR